MKPELFCIKRVYDVTGWMMPHFLDHEREMSMCCMDWRRFRPCVPPGHNNKRETIEEQCRGHSLSISGRSAYRICHESFVVVSPVCPLDLSSGLPLAAEEAYDVWRKATGYPTRYDRRTSKKLTVFINL